jgi:O-antigen ligase
LTAALGALTFVLAKSPRRGKIAAGLVVLLLAFVTAGVFSQTASRYSSQFDRRTNAITLHLDSYRANEYHAVWVQIRQNVLWGQGFGTDYIGDWTTNRSWAHNAYEWLWWRVGFVGVGCFLLLLLAATTAGISAWKRTGDANDRALALGLTIGVIFTALASNFHLNFEESQNNLFIGLAVAQILILACRQARV